MMPNTLKAKTEETRAASHQGQVLLIDDEIVICRLMEKMFRSAGFNILSMSRAEAALSRISKSWPGIVVSDVKMPGMDGLTLLKKVMEIDPDIPVILATGHGDIPMAVGAMREGAYDFVEKPFDFETLAVVARHALEKRRLILENRGLRSEIEKAPLRDCPIVGKSPVMQHLLQVLDRIADYNADVLIHGETGTGKEVTARYLHDCGSKRKGPFVAVNCCAVPEDILESELFGHEAGSFTGASHRRIGKFEFATGGTIFLDEIDSMPLHLQAKLLRVLQERAVERLGANEIIPVDIRVIATTKIDLKQASAAGRFREDLYYRLNVIDIVLPPLRERREDIPALFQHFVLQGCAKYQRPLPLLAPAMLNGLMERDWPGNVRELKNEADRFVMGYQGTTFNIFGVKETPDAAKSGNGHRTTLTEQVDAFEKSVIERELARNKGDVKASHTALGMPRKTFYERLRKYGLKRDDFVESTEPH